MHYTQRRDHDTKNNTRQTVRDFPTRQARWSTLYSPVISPEFVQNRSLIVCGLVQRRAPTSKPRRPERPNESGFGQTVSLRRVLGGSMGSGEVSCLRLGLCRDQQFLSYLASMDLEKLQSHQVIAYLTRKILSQRAQSAPAVRRPSTQPTRE